MTEYPDTLPLPDWPSYTGTINPGLVRTSVPAAQAQQYKRYNASRTELSLTWSMTNDDFQIWDTWVKQYGYYWFLMPVVNEQIPSDIMSVRQCRFMGDIQYVKRGDNWLSISVPVELLQAEIQ